MLRSGLHLPCATQFRREATTTGAALGSKPDSASLRATATGPPDAICTCDVERRDRARASGPSAHSERKPHRNGLASTWRSVTQVEEAPDGRGCTQRDS